MCMNEMVDWGKMGGETRRIKFVIPVGNPNKKWWQFWKKSGVSAKEAQETVSKLISDYKEDIKWDDETGEVSINGDKQIPYQKEYWIPSNSDEKVDITITLDENGNIKKQS